MLSDKAKSALSGAMATKGSYRGFIKKRAPRANTLENAAWNAVAMAVNPFKVSMCACMFFTDEQRAVFDEVLAHVEGLPAGERLRLDKDRMQLQSWGVW